MVNQAQTSLSWLDEDINLSVFSDRRHASCFKNLMQKLWRGMGESLPFACQEMQRQKRLPTALRKSAAVRYPGSALITHRSG
ncbi:TPA_asm: hypothetical protein G4G51_004584 [Salmonella enterica subsp. enterica serovar Dublin]|uniref:Transposase Tn5-like N-terminal domain-containing protein n=1 Tax=Salmonella dublin TaxID=98360 RepID=A0A732D6J2_SALDU|nr:hypothetical protein [Salmonella enterica subsp. enterica serovar 4,[5],12:b:-]EKR1395907.1 hypothetical protein [Salmonella enterica subsp. enterica serovar Dublin]EKR1404961.1 hypothetical protein [Salmonella enterica subsp. enterica serovar Dublin]HAE4979929.1 hypothetical protein [Salmonella enterica subsp. enterica serovar Dublin]